MSDEIIEINGKNYQIEEGYGDTGPSYHEMEFLPARTENYGPYWNVVYDAPVLCGKCKGDTFKVSTCNRDYESWAYCSCGNKFIVHSG